jgi:hypothetical protein
LCIANYEIVQPPLRIHSNESEPANFERGRSGTPIPRKHPDVAAACQIRDHALLKPHGIKSVCAAFLPVVITWYEDPARARGNCSQLILESSSCIGPCQCAIDRDSVGIDIVAKENDDSAARCFRSLPPQRIENEPSGSRILLAGIAYEEKCSLDFLFLLDVLHMNAPRARAEQKRRKNYCAEVPDPDHAIHQNDIPFVM